VATNQSHQKHCQLNLSRHFKTGYWSRGKRGLVHFE
jgi:hypothetical protein